MGPPYQVLSERPVGGATYLWPFPVQKAPHAAVYALSIVETHGVWSRVDTLSCTIPHVLDHYGLHPGPTIPAPSYAR